jgi:hypothetical protein
MSPVSPKDLSGRMSQRLANWEVFPYGIIEWDMFRVQVAFEVNELEGKVPPRGFEG